jgi:TolB-like protein/DNA-binding winged helix-turn-helix (wHTH) protein/tetratricopeptide (TPR) repeat protein
LSGPDRPHAGSSPDVGPVIRFGVFELDSRAGELRRQGARVRLQEKPFQILELLIARAGEAVSREELRGQLWPGDVFVDFDHSLNSAVSKLRDALRDTAANPQFIETLPRGYRFIAPVTKPADWPSSDGHAAELRAAPLQHPDTPDGAAGSSASNHSAPTRASRRRPWVILAIVAGLVAIVATGWTVVSRLNARPPGASDNVALVVLPFQNLSADDDQEFFGDGITEEMIAQLGKVDPEHLRVIARTSAMHYKHTDKRIDQIGAELNVDYILEGSVRRAGTRVRITAQLVRVRDQVRIWVQSYDRDMGDMLQLQTEVAQATVREIAITFDRPATLPGAPPKVDPAVYEAYLKGRYFLDKAPAPAALTKSIDYFNEALRLDPTHAGAQAGLADAYGILGWGIAAGLPPRDAYPKALAAAERALALNPQLAAAHVALARIRWKYERDWAGAETSFKRALQLDPSASTAHESYFDYLSAMGRNNEAFVELEKAAALDPVSLTVAYDFGLHFERTGDNKRASEALKRALDIDPTSGFVHYLLGQFHIDHGRYGEAIAELEKAVESSPNAPTFVATLGHVRGLAGDRTAALRALETLQRQATQSYVSPYALAVLQVGLGDKRAALDLLEEGYRERDPWLSMLRVQPRLQSLYHEPRFVALLHRLRLSVPEPVGFAPR